MKTGLIWLPSPGQDVYSWHFQEASFGKRASFVLPSGHSCSEASSCRDLVPLGQTKSNFNFNLDEKRVLNFENEVSDADNIKQDMSIDVYGRKDEEPTEAKAAPPPKQQAEV